MAKNSLKLGIARLINRKFRICGVIKMKTHKCKNCLAILEADDIDGSVWGRGQRHKFVKCTKCSAYSNPTLKSLLLIRVLMIIPILIILFTSLINPFLEMLIVFLWLFTMRIKGSNIIKFELKL